MSAEGIVRKVAASYIDAASPGTSKVWRGFNNTITARLLCPAKYLERFKGDPEGYMQCFGYRTCVLMIKRRTRQDLKHRRLRLIDREGSPFFPTFLYDEEMMDGTSTKGLFRGPLLIKVSFTPPEGDYRQSLPGISVHFPWPNRKSHGGDEEGKKKG